MIDSGVRFIVYVTVGVAMAWIGLFAVVYPSYFLGFDQSVVLVFFFGGSFIALWLASLLR